MTTLLNTNWIYKRFIYLGIPLFKDQNTNKTTIFQKGRTKQTTKKYSRR